MTDTVADGAGEHGDLSLAGSFEELWGRVLASAGRSAWPLTVAAVLPFTPVVLLGQALWVRLTADGTYVNGSLLVTDPRDPVTLWGLAALGALALLVAPIAAGTSAALATGALLGRRVAVRDARRSALRRYATVAALLVTALLLVVGTVTATLSVYLSDEDWYWLGVLIPIPGLLLLPPVVTAVPVAVAEGRGPVSALAQAWRIRRERRLTALGFVLVVLLLVVLVIAGGGLAVAWAAGWGLLHPASPAIAGLGVLLCAAPCTVLVCAPLAAGRVYVRPGVLNEGPYTTIDLERVAATLPAPAVRGPFRPGRTAAALAALLLPPLAGPAVAWADPFGTPYLTRTALRDGNDMPAALPSAGEALFAEHVYRPSVPWCGPDCERWEEPWADVRGLDTTMVWDRIVTSGWVSVEPVRVDEGGDDVEWKDQEYEHDERSGLYLWSCDPDRECETTVLLHGTVRSYADTALTTVGDRVVVVASAEFDAITPEEQELAAAGEFEDFRTVLYTCADLTCSDPTVSELPLESRAWASYRASEALDIAAHPDEGFIVTAYDTRRRGLDIIACAADCAAPVITTVVEPLISKTDAIWRSGEDDRDFGKHAGARAVYRADGTPFIVYTAPDDGTARMVDCHDPLCTDFTDREIPGSAPGGPIPGLAVDAAGNPRLLTYAEESPGDRLVLISCPDGTCGRTAATGLSRMDAEPSLTALALDADGLPHIVVEAPGELFHLTCGTPFCRR